MKKVVHCLAIVLVIGLGLFLRIRPAVLRDMWLDEVSLFVTSQLPLRKLILMEHGDQSHPQLYFIFSHFWQKTNTTPFFLRLPTVISFIPSAVLVFKITEMITSIPVAYCSMLIFATHPFFVNFGWQQRMYGFEILFILSSLFFILKSLRENKKIWLILAILFTVLAFYTDYSSIWYLVCLFLAFVLMFLLGDKIKWRHSHESLFFILIISAILFLPQLPLFIKGLPKALSDEKYISRVTLANVHYLVQTMSGLFTKDLNFIPSYLLFLLSFMGIVCLGKKKQEKRFFSFLLMGVAVFPVAISFLLSQISPIFLARNLLVVAFLPIFGLPLLLFRSKNKVALFFLSFLFIFYLFKIFSASFNSNSPWLVYPGEWGELRERIFSSPGKKLIVWLGKDSWALNPLLNYYLLGFDYGKDEEIDFDYELAEINNRQEIYKLKEHQSISDVWIFYYSEGAYVGGDAEEQKKLLNEVRSSLECNRKNCWEEVF